MLSGNKCFCWILFSCFAVLMGFALGCGASPDGQLFKQLEVVSAPDEPSGPGAGAVNRPMTFTAGGSVCECGAGVQYRFFWPDMGAENNRSEFSFSNSIVLIPTEAGVLEVRAQAFCGHGDGTGAVSRISEPKKVLITAQ